MRKWIPLMIMGTAFWFVVDPLPFWRGLLAACLCVAICTWADICVEADRRVR